MGGGFFGREAVGAFLLSSAMAKRACLVGELFSGVFSIAAGYTSLDSTNVDNGVQKLWDTLSSSACFPAMHKLSYSLS
jgi:hypothetical protein